MKNTLLIVTLTLLLSGCNSGIRVTGTAAFTDGAPLTNGVVIFDNGSGKTFQGQIGSGGRFAMEQNGRGIPAGSYRIYLSGVTETAAKPGLSATVPAAALAYYSADQSGWQYDIASKTDISLFVERLDAKTKERFIARQTGLRQQAEQRKKALQAKSAKAPK